MSFYLSIVVDLFSAKIAGYTFIWTTYEIETWTHPQTILRQFIVRQFIERQFIKRQLIETTVHWTTIYRTDNLSNRQFIEPTVYRTNSLSNRQFIEPTVYRTNSLSNDSLSNDSLSNDNLSNDSLWNQKFIETTYLIQLSEDDHGVVMAWSSHCNVQLQSQLSTLVFSKCTVRFYLSLVSTGIDSRSQNHNQRSKQQWSKQLWVHVT